MRFVRRVDRLCVAVAAVLAFVAILPDAEYKVDGMYYTGHVWPRVSCVRRRALDAENVLRHRDDTCSASCNGEYSIRSIRILLRWLTDIGERIWKLQVQIGERLWNTTSTAIGERHYYYKYGIGERPFYLLSITTAENSASFYIAHIVHYSPI